MNLRHSEDNSLGKGIFFFELQSFMLLVLENLRTASRLKCWGDAKETMDLMSN